MGVMLSSKQEGRLVLLVDDDAEFRDAMSSLLEEHGFRVVTAANGLVALDYLQHGEQPRVILLDLWMPVMDGWQLRRLLELDADFRHIPVVVISAAFEQRAGAMRVEEVLPKPASADRVLAALYQHAG